MNERMCRLNEIDLLETYLNHNGIDNGPIRNYVGHRRTVIADEFPEPVEVEAPSNENEAQTTTDAPATGQEPAEVVSASELDDKPADQASGDGTQSPAPDAPQEQPSASGQ